ncbi:MAG: D-aminoacyl-tRNA deacylase [Acidimicrobiales bacterium]
MYRPRMRAVVQRVSHARVTVGGDVVGSIGPGLCVLVGVTHDDTELQARKLADKLWTLRIFADDDDKMNLSVADIGGEILLVSQFTLYADATKGNRPSYVQAARPEYAAPLIEYVGDRLRSLGVPVATGRFGADMNVELLNQGPVTISLEL